MTAKLLRHKYLLRFLDLRAKKLEFLDISLAKEQCTESVANQESFGACDIGFGSASSGWNPV